MSSLPRRHEIHHFSLFFYGELMEGAQRGGQLRAMFLQLM